MKRHIFRYFKSSSRTQIPETFHNLPIWAFLSDRIHPVESRHSIIDPSATAHVSHASHGIASAPDPRPSTVSTVS